MSRFGDGLSDRELHVALWFFGGMAVFAAVLFAAAVVSMVIGIFS